MLKALLFDFWFTLVVFGSEKEQEKLKRLRVQEMLRVFQDKGFDIKAELLVKAMEDIEREAHEIRTSKDVEVSSREIPDGIKERLGISVAIQGLREAYDSPLFSIDIVPQKDAKKTLEELKKMGIKLGIVSNTSHGEILREILKKFELFSYFDVFLFSDEFGLRKPRAEIFEAAIQKIGTTKEETGHIGDRPDLDVLGAKRAGLFAIYLDADGKPYPEGLPLPDLTISRLSELPSLICN